MCALLRLVVMLYLELLTITIMLEKWIPSLLTKGFQSTLLPIMASEDGKILI